ncbi:MAG: hydroxyphenylacetyl-CoA thioesterase PaaI [Chromatiales bacterium]|nr:hydroxyphenylacetyl-CoA thioesterase PaaI [Chromatiales bacterium]
MDPLDLANRCVDALYKRDAAAGSLGILVLEVSPGRAAVSMQVRPDMCNGHGICHGGMLFTLADTAMAYASNSHGKVAVASSVNIDFLRSAAQDDVLLAEAVEVYRGRRKASYQVTVSRGEAVQIAHFHGTVAILDRDVL